MSTTSYAQARLKIDIKSQGLAALRAANPFKIYVVYSALILT